MSRNQLLEKSRAPGGADGFYPGRELNGSVWLCGGIILGLLVVGSHWAATAALSGAAIAQGTVGAEGRRQTVQHLEGGIIREIRVSEGEEVSRGDLLVVLEGAGASADVDTLTLHLRAVAGKEARLRAERAGTAMIDFSHPALSARNDPEVQAVIAQESNLFQARRAADESRRAILKQRIAQLDQQIAGSERQLDGVRQQMRLIQEETVAVPALLGEGLERKLRLLALQRAEAGLVGTEGELVARIAQTQQASGETRLQILDLHMERIEEVEADLAATQAARIDTERQLREGIARRSQTAILAPTDGTVLDVRFKMPGEVIRPGERVLDIVRSGAELTVDARIPPADIDAVHAGRPVYISSPGARGRER